MSLQNISDSTKLLDAGTIGPSQQNLIINHAGVQRLEERVHLLQLDNFEYDRRGLDPGRVIIFNQEFRDNRTLIREGSRRDVNEIILCFQRLGFNIFEEDVLVDQTQKQISDKLDAVVKDRESLKATNCLIIFFMTHGETNNWLSVKDGTINCSEIWTKFLKCLALQGKPKMFVFQACKGEYYASIDRQPANNENNTNPSQLLDMDGFSVNQLAGDMLILFSTLEGNQSYRHASTGSWFIQELCKNFSMYGRRDDVISLITRTMKCICGNYYLQSDRDDVIVKQMPIFVSTLTKKFYLNRNKDRHLLLEINKKQDELFNLLKEIGELMKQQNTSKK